MARSAPASVIYQAVETWRATCLLDEGSVFGSNNLWNAKIFEMLDTYYAQNLDEGEGNFFGKLERQLAPAPKEAKRLASEIFWVMYLFPVEEAMGAATKRRQIRTVWEWSGDRFPADAPMAREPLESGIGHPGTAFNTHRWREFLWMIIAFGRWVALARGSREVLLADCWKFAEWLESMPESKGRQMRHVLLHLLFPESFERMSTASHKRKIVDNFAEVGGISPDSIDHSDRILLDRQILQIRAALEMEYGKGFDFYKPEIRGRWDVSPESGVPDVRRTPPRIDTTELDQWYGKRFGDARVWAIAPGRGGFLWPEFRDEGVIAIGWDDLGDLLEYSSKEQIEESLKTIAKSSARQFNNALACFEFAHVMREGDIVIAKRGRSGLLGYGEISSSYRFDETRSQYLHLRDVSWKKIGNWNLPTDQWIAQKALTDFTSYREWIHLAIDIMDGNRMPSLRADEVHEDAPVYAREEALEDLFMTSEQFDSMQQALLRTKALILTGAPGVGKTFVSRRLAWSVMRRRDDRRVRFVQFHQSYAYEDFVQGWRPTESGGFELRNGVFYSFCMLARSDQENDYVFIIDEINRANLSKVFGELLMLIEADKRNPGYAVKLAYASEDEEPFHVPENVYIIGLMNTADRSLALVDYALRRRFSFINLPPAFETEAFFQYLVAKGADEELTSLIVERMCALNGVIRSDTVNLGRGFEIGHSYFVPRAADDSLDREWYARIIAYEVEPLLREYWFDQPEKVDEEIGKLLT